ncbi:mannose-6-phosphate isomerase, class I [Streptomonospora sp. S1-112]|uniref:mannose-6-phosphate isomerase n=1 Tax=Streptomonospora mangrovi TaxID=2883123 RepID=A0A9X3NIN3_9ACTN|nr:mannose-6-phosphate isomerase, class I [Streptomonospora mangrovi]MDA0563770.1 mannose-6-phosphate isomerase, class I [Streptomonospora mangrovi]
MHRLINRIRPYPWGARTAIPRLLGVEPDGRPQAELWLGAHPGAPSTVVTPDGAFPFADVIAAAPADMLGEATVSRFGERLPFLLKVLAAEAPLSLQVHPDAERARAGFAAEEAAGIPVTAPHRNYRDPFHKPELVLALEPFEALCGFRDPAAARADLEGLGGDLAEVLRRDLADPDPHRALRAALTRLLSRESACERDVGAFVAEWKTGGTGAHHDTVVELAERYPGDPGAVAALLLNRVSLRPGEALFLPAGNVHAYLRGTAVEVMASSDNVLRAGLTGKHVDTAELLSVVDFSVLPIPYTGPVEVDGRAEFRPGVPEFALATLGPGPVETRLPGGAPAIALALEGGADLVAESGDALSLARGESVFVPARAGHVKVRGEGHLVVATVGHGPEVVGG